MVCYVIRDKKKYHLIKRALVCLPKDCGGFVVLDRCNGSMVDYEMVMEIGKY